MVASTRRRRQSVGIATSSVALTVLALLLPSAVLAAPFPDSTDTCPSALPGENVVGGATTGDDLLLGTSGPDLICGLEGSDTIRGFGGNDRLYGGPDDDPRIEGGPGNDYIDGGSATMATVMPLATSRPPLPPATAETAAPMAATQPALPSRLPTAQTTGCSEAGATTRSSAATGMMAMVATAETW